MGWAAGQPLEIQKGSEALWSFIPTISEHPFSDSPSVLVRTACARGLLTLHNWMVAKSHLWPKLFSLFSDRAMRIPPWMWLFHKYKTRLPSKHNTTKAYESSTSMLCQYVSVQGGLKEGIWFTVTVTPWAAINDSHRTLCVRPCWAWHGIAIKSRKKCRHVTSRFSIMPWQSDVEYHFNIFQPCFQPISMLVPWRLRLPHGTINHLASKCRIKVCACGLSRGGKADQQGRYGFAKTRYMHIYIILYLIYIYIYIYYKIYNI